MRPAFRGTSEFNPPSRVLEAQFEAAEFFLFVEMPNSAVRIDMWQVQLQDASGQGFADAV